LILFFSSSSSSFLSSTRSFGTNMKVRKAKEVTNIKILRIRARIWYGENLYPDMNMMQAKNTTSVAMKMLDVSQKL